MFYNCVIPSGFWEMRMRVISTIVSAPFGGSVDAVDILIVHLNIEYHTHKHETIRH